MCIDQESERAHKLELLSVTTLQFTSHLCSLNLGQIDAFEYALKALYESWQNYLIFLREIFFRALTPENVYYSLNLLEMDY